MLGELRASADLPPPDEATLLLELAAVEMTSGNVDAARDRAERALALARDARCAATNTVLMTTALGVLATANELSGEVAGADRCLSEAALLLDAALDGELAAHADAALWVASAENHLERYPDALRHLSRTVPRPRDGGCHAILPRLLVEQARHCAGRACCPTRRPCTRTRSSPR